jgi:hypothetical protein
MNKLKFFLFSLSLGLVLALGPISALAQTGTQPATNNIQISFQNPLKSPDLDSLISDIVAIIIYIAVPVMGLYIMYVGFLYVKAQGQPNAIKEANENLKGVLIGSAVILGAGTILTIIQGTINAIKGS